MNVALTSTPSRPELLLAAAILAIVMVAMPKLFECDIRLYRKWGWTRLAEFWERTKAPWVRACRWLCAIGAVLLIVAAFRPGAPPVAGEANSLLVIVPYRHAGTWVFDDSARGLQREPFVAGVPELIDRLVSDIPDAGDGFRLTFSAQEFPGYEDKLTWRRAGESGNWYYSETFQAEGWLCPALLKYFRTAPRELYVRADPK